INFYQPLTGDEHGGIRLAWRGNLCKSAVPDAIASRQGAHSFRARGNLRAPQALSGRSYADEVPSSSSFLFLSEYTTSRNTSRAKTCCQVDN
ncbi:MAG: hypothetical protein LBO00_00290, partial [Zoogloeaceae bacterium]|nr:hypothetical protein [Zoogloeaceae bacterium]